MEFVGVYGDHGKSGRTMQGRKEMNRLIKDCEAKKIDLVLTKSISRFARNLQECVQTIRLLKELGVTVRFEKEGYDTLATYHAMLFPSFWRGEGFAGIFIDAFIAGLPVLASDWAHNAESITDGKLGIIYPVHNVVELTQTMEDCIDGKFDLEGMARNARKEAQKYQTNHALSEDYLKSIGLIK
jgi:glycosyltransferase involved in cell wall biosynthesis